MTWYEGSDNIGAKRVPAIATGAFTVTLKPQPISELASASEIGRMSIDKQFSGDLMGTSKGEMLSAMSAVKGSAGYVAIERVSGTIGDKRGTFVLQHFGTMNRGAPTLTVSVVPDSGTDGKHLYTFNYSLPD